MSSDVYSETEYCTVRWDDELEAAVMEWHEFAQGEDYRKPLNDAVELIRDRGAEKLLGDSRDMGAVTDEDKQWIIREWMPNAVEAGLAYSAVVYPENIIAKMSLDSMEDEGEEPPIETINTDDVDEAREWLDSR